MGLEQFFNYKIKVDLGEAMLLDWILTLHNFNEYQLEWLTDIRAKGWREQIGLVICGKSKIIELTEEDLILFLILVPITFRFDQKDVGYSLKQKLYQAYLGVTEEEINDNKNKDKTQSNTSNETESGPNTYTAPLWSGEDLSEPI